MQTGSLGKSRDKVAAWFLENRGLILGATVVILAAISLLGAVSSFKETKKEQVQVEVKPTFVETEEGGPRRDWEALWDANEDICAWITVESADIDLPVFKSDQSYFYLDHDVNGDWSEAGSIVLDEYCDTPDIAHCMVYGHHLYSGGMFSNLQLAYQQEVLDALSDLTWDTPESGPLTLHPLCASSVDKSYRLVRQYSFVDAAAMGEWLTGLCSDADAQVADAEALCTTATRAVTCVTCSSDWAGQPERTIVTFVATAPDTSDSSAKK